MDNFWYRQLVKEGYSSLEAKSWNGKSWICPTCKATETINHTKDGITLILCPYCSVRGEKVIMRPRLNGKGVKHDYQRTS